MKKILLCLLGALFLMNCDISMKKSNAQTGGNSQHIVVDNYTIDGMNYAAFTVVTKQTNGNSFISAISVVNVTRDKLQCEIIQSNLKKNGTDRREKSNGSAIP